MHNKNNPSDMHTSTDQKHADMLDILVAVAVVYSPH